MFTLKSLFRHMLARVTSVDVTAFYRESPKLSLPQRDFFHHGIFPVTSQNSMYKVQR